jgi:hypothetical protein
VGEPIRQRDVYINKEIPVAGSGGEVTYKRAPLTYACILMSFPSLFDSLRLVLPPIVQSVTRRYKGAKGDAYVESVVLTTSLDEQLVIKVSFFFASLFVSRALNFVHQLKAGPRALHPHSRAGRQVQQPSRTEGRVWPDRQPRGHALHRSGLNTPSSRHPPVS